MIQAAVLCALCADAYVQPPAWQDPGSDIRALRADRDGLTVVAVPGTQNLEDALRDAHCLPRLDADLGWCPAGFLGEALRLLELIAEDLAGTRLVLTGHSLGGAVAILIAGKLAARGRPPLGVTTFGAPRTGFGRLARATAGLPMTLYRHGNDPVPDLPPLFRHPRAPTPIGTALADPLSCHFLAGYAAALPPAALPPGP